MASLVKKQLASNSTLPLEAFSAANAASTKRDDAWLTKTLGKLMGRIERIIVPPNEIRSSNSSISEKFEVLMKSCHSGIYYQDSKVYQLFEKPEIDDVNNIKECPKQTMRIINWEKLEPVLMDIICETNNGIIPPLIYEEIEGEKHVQEVEENRQYAKEKSRIFHGRNKEPQLPGKWRKEPYPPRQYHAIEDYICTENINAEEGMSLKQSLESSLDGFVGYAYNFDDFTISEEWMANFKDASYAAPSDDDVIKNQISSLLEIVKIQVQDRVCNETNVLGRGPLGIGPSLKEEFVWGIDCYTQRMIEIAVEDNVDPVYFRKEDIASFIEKKLLPAINAQAPQSAHNMTYALKSIMSSISSTSLDHVYANAILKSIDKLSIDTFKIHPKGRGIICTNPLGIPPHVFITEYLGEIYPPYRWCERLEVIKQTQEKFQLRPSLPDFYNIVLERPRQDVNGYSVIYVDASQKCNMGSCCSHSCNPNLTSNIVARNGKLTIALTTTRHIFPGEELTMNYSAITSSEMEWRAAICLCGTSECRGSFLSFSTDEDLQQVFNSNCGPLRRYSSLLRACSSKPLSVIDKATLERHGMRSAALGLNPSVWMQKYAADNLTVVEYERRALPCALLRSKNGKNSEWSVQQADETAQVVMNGRLQSLVYAFSMIGKVIERQPVDKRDKLPVHCVNTADAVLEVYKYMSQIPDLIREYCGKQSLAGGKGKSKNSNTQSAEELIIEKVKRVQHDTKVLEIIQKIRVLLLTKPSSLPSIRKLCLNIREAVLQIEDRSTKVARLGLLADILVLWAYTSNFSYVEVYDEIESESLPVVARELGTNILRSKIVKPENVGKKKTASSGTPSNLNESVLLDSVDNIASNDPSATVFMNVTKAKEDAILDPNEVVDIGSMKYDKMFIFSQLLAWFDAGTDNKLGPPELFGCVRLPTPAMCFGASESAYLSPQRDILYSLLRNEKTLTQPWPKKLQSCFSASSDSMPLYGSPMLDTTLGQVDAVVKVIKELTGCMIKGFTSGDAQPDELLPPEASCDWVQCERESCRKWRRVAWNVDMDSLPDVWYCEMNSWSLESASCDTPQDMYDPFAESAMDYKAEGEGERSWDEGLLYDVFCTRNRFYYEGEIKETKTDKDGKLLVKFHFKGWSSKFDEWISHDSDRIQAHNLYTTGLLSKPHEQEKWQGGEVISNAKLKKVDVAQKKAAEKIVKQSLSKLKKRKLFEGEKTFPSKKKVADENEYNPNSSTDEPTCEYHMEIEAETIIFE